MRRLLLPLESQVIGAYIDPRSLQKLERQKLESGEGRCYLAQDSVGTVTVFLAMTMHPSSEGTTAVRGQYARSLKRQKDLNGLFSGSSEGSPKRENTPRT